MLDDVSAVGLGFVHSGALKKDGTLWMWGWNNVGQLGDGTTDYKGKPVKIMDGVVVPSNEGSNSTTANTSETKPTTASTSTTKPTTASTGTTKPTTPSTSQPKPTTPSTSQPQPTKKTQTIQVSSRTVVYKSKPFSLKAKASGNGKLTYKSSNSKIAAVSSTGKVTVKNYGKATITVKAAARGNYLAATKKISITVVPKKMKLKSVSSPGKTRIKISWVTDKTVTGYEAQISTDKRFKKETFERWYKKSKSSYDTKGLWRKKKYYVRIRSYKKVGSKKYYGAWSSVKSIKIK